MMIRSVRVRRIRGPVRIGGATLSRFPVLVWSDSGIDEYALKYLHRRFTLETSGSVGTIELECYILAEWFNWLATYRLSIYEPSLAAFMAWRESFRHRTKRGRNSLKFDGGRHRQKIKTVWNFYDFLREKSEHWPTIKPFFSEISTLEISFGGVEVWKLKPRGGSQNPRRPIVPSDDEVKKVLATLGDVRDSFLSERNFLIGSVEARVGLRAMGAEGLSIGSLDVMLRTENLLPDWLSVDQLHSDKATQVTIRRRLQQLAARGQNAVFLPVTEKGGKRRDVRVPIDLAVLLLNHVWGRRRSVVTSRTGARYHLQPHDSLFVSLTDGAPLTRGSIKDLTKDAFVKAGVRGSGHALRASYLTNRAIDMIIEGYRLYGRGFDITNVYTDLAQEAGHNHYKTLKSYVDVAKVNAKVLAFLATLPNDHEVQ